VAVVVAKTAAEARCMFQKRFSMRIKRERKRVFFLRSFFQFMYYPIFIYTLHTRRRIDDDETDARREKSGVKGEGERSRERAFFLKREPGFFFLSRSYGSKQQQQQRAFDDDFWRQPKRRHDDNNNCRIGGWRERRRANFGRFRERSVRWEIEEQRWWFW